MIVGIPKEIMQNENRVAAVPETVAKMVKDGVEVIVERGAGVGSYYEDEEYVKAGAKIVDNPEEVFLKSDLILKVKEPLFNEKIKKYEVDMMHENQYLITFIHPASPVNHPMVRKMADKGIISLTLDGVPRISRAQSMDALSSMSSCAGYKGMLMAANDISKFIPMITSAIGMIKPATVFVIGAGVAGLRAIATAKGLGAIVYAADIRPEAVEQAKSLGAKIIETGVPEDIAVSKDGKHANLLPEKWLEIERNNFKEIIAKADIVFCSALVLGKVAPVLIDEEMLKLMPKGSCIVDISIDQGGNCSLTTPGKKDTKHGVIIEGIKNIPGLLPTSSTWMFSHNIYNMFKYIYKQGKIELDINDEIIKSVLVTKDHRILHEGTLEAMALK